MILHMTAVAYCRQVGHSGIELDIFIKPMVIFTPDLY
jgi:hypothetical protein